MRQLKVLLVFFLLLFLIACGSSKKSITIALSPTTASVFTGQNQQFTATVSDGSTNVGWAVNGIAFGDLTVGTINSAGLYTAPATVPTPASVTITAVPASDTTKSATATVTIQAGANLSITPSSLSMNAGASQTFVVKQNGTANNTGITFSLSCKSSAPGACGSVTADGVYTAPLSPPPNGGNVILTANLTQGTATFSTSATITILSSSQGSAGQYAFTLSGKNNGNSYQAAGSISLDGNGNITGGSEDINNQGTVSARTIAGGTYTFSASDGRITANVQTSNGNVAWYMVLINRSSGYIEEAGSGVSLSGTMSLQNPNSFSLASLNGNYTFRVAGFDTGTSASLAEVGGFNSDGAGNIPNGFLDANAGGTLSSNQAVTGTATAPAAGNGRGTITLTSGFGTQNFAYYLVDGSQFKLVETDATHALAGDAVQQTNGPYTVNSFHGTLATLLSGTVGSKAFGLGGTIPISTGTVVGGSIDRNDAGIFTGGQVVSGGSYTVTDPATGRTELTINYGTTSTVAVLYPQSNTRFSVLDASTSEVGSGVAVVATGGNGTNSTLQGNYALHLSGAVGSTPEDVTGKLNANGGGVFTGTVDITNGGANTALQSSPYAVANVSTATLKSGFANFNSVGFNLYIVDSTQVLFLENDTKGVLTGIMLTQN